MSDTGSPYDAELGPRNPTPPPPKTKNGVDRGILAGCLIVLGALGLTIVAVILLHSSPVVAYEGRPFDVEGSTTGSDVGSDIRCVPAVGGTDGFVLSDPDQDEEQADRTVLEYSGGLSSEIGERGIRAGDVSVLCNRARAARIAHAGENGFIALLLLAVGISVTRRAWRKDSE